MRGFGPDCIGSGWVLVVGCCEHGNETSNSVKDGDDFTP